nr:unnamed protein product [Callosobruchus chinensis]
MLVRKDDTSCIILIKDNESVRKLNFTGN